MMKVLFVCHGNICRSVSAQYIFQDLVNRRGLTSEFVIDSAATSTEEIGNAIYPPMKAALERRGVTVGTHQARQLQRSDYEAYDLLIGMDEENMFYMRRILGEDPKGKIRRGRFIISWSTPGVQTRSSTIRGTRGSSMRAQRR